jgi:predicted O-methyltransferase YrrM
MTSVEKMYSLHKAVQYICHAKIPGAFVECGVWKGGSAMNMALSLRAMNAMVRDFYLYDTFAGMTAPTEKDKRMNGSQRMLQTWNRLQRNDHNKWCYSPLESVKENLQKTDYPETRIHYVRGKVEDTLPNKIPTEIALLRLDTDWYSSTYHELVHLYPLLSPGGVLIIDDYFLFSGQKEAVDEYFSKNNIPIFFQRIDSGGVIAIKIN